MPLIVAMIVMGGGAFSGLLLAVLVRQHNTSAVQTDEVAVAVGLAVLGGLAGSYVTAIVFCALKDKSGFATVGGLGLLAPLVGGLPGVPIVVMLIVGAIRLAKPTSTWARRYYSEERMRAAILRFPRCYTSLRNDSSVAIEVSRDPPGGSRYLIEPGRATTFLCDVSSVGIVIHTSTNRLHYNPLPLQFQPTAYKGRPKYSYVFTADHLIYPLNANGAIIHDAQGFPWEPLQPTTDLRSR
jgi:hypothetical protein